MFYRFAKLVCRAVLLLIRRWQVQGQNNIPPDGGMVLVSNHASYWDPVVVGCAMTRQVHFMAKAELFNPPILGPVITWLGAFPVKRGGSDRNAIRRALELLNNGRVVGIFPEGTRSKTGELMEPHLGAAMLALRSGVPIIPTAVINTRGLFGKVRVRFGRPLVFPELEGKKISRGDLENVSRLLMDEISNLFKN